MQLQHTVSNSKACTRNNCFDLLKTKITKSDFEKVDSSSYEFHVLNDTIHA